MSWISLLNDLTDVGICVGGVVAPAYLGLFLWEKRHLDRGVQRRPGRKGPKNRPSD